MSNGTNGDTNFGHQDGTDLRDLFNAQFKVLQTLIDANDKNYNQRFDNVSQATSAALASADRANTKAETATEKRFDSVNEFRATLQDQQRTFIPRAEMEITLKGINDKIDINSNGLEALRLVQSINQGTKLGITQGWGYAFGIVMTIIAILTIMFKLFG
jgi:hypothetical protein